MDADPISTTRAQAGGESGVYSGSSSRRTWLAPGRGNSPITVRHEGRKPPALHVLWG